MIIVVLLLFAQLAYSALIFNGNFDFYTAANEIDQWSWSNQIGEWRMNLHGGTKMSDYLTLSPSYKHPGDTVAKQGAALKINATSSWSGQTMMRTELTPNNFDNTVNQVGVLYYQWSMKQGTSDQVNASYVHRLMFMEPMFASLNYGGGSTDLYLTTDDSNKLYSIPFTPDVWLNFALKVDYTNKKIAFYSSTGNGNLVQVVPDTAANTQVADWHVGHLRFPYQFGTYQGTQNEIIYYSSLSIQRDNYIDAVSGVVYHTPAPTPTPSASTSDSSTSSQTPTPTNSPVGTSGSASTCVIGERGCSCTPNGGCDPGLTCSDKFCLVGSSSVNSGAMCSASIMLLSIAALI